MDSVSVTSPGPSRRVIVKLIMDGSLRLHLDSDFIARLAANPLVGEEEDCGWSRGGPRWCSRADSLNHVFNPQYNWNGWVIPCCKNKSSCIIYEKITLLLTSFLTSVNIVHMRLSSQLLVSRSLQNGDQEADGWRHGDFVHLHSQCFVLWGPWCQYQLQWQCIQWLGNVATCHGPTNRQKNQPCHAQKHPIHLAWTSYLSDLCNSSECQTQSRILRDAVCFVEVLPRLK